MTAVAVELVLVSKQYLILQRKIPLLPSYRWLSYGYRVRMAVLHRGIIAGMLSYCPLYLRNRWITVVVGPPWLTTQLLAVCFEQWLSLVISIVQSSSGYLCTTEALSGGYCGI